MRLTTKRLNRRERRQQPFSNVFSKGEKTKEKFYMLEEERTMIFSNLFSSIDASSRRTKIPKPKLKVRSSSENFFFVQLLLNTDQKTGTV
jgi:hypothetical protein